MSEFNPVDLERLHTWPGNVLDFLQEHADALRSERTVEHIYNLAGSLHRLRNPAPVMRHWREAEALIAETMVNRELRAFHATRLADFDSIRREGLLRLNIARDLERLKRTLAGHLPPERIGDVDAALATMLAADPHFLEREGAIWATPMRRFLHDGGCEVFFESFGGEAVERLAGYLGGELPIALKGIGEPAVVVIRYPASGWCAFTDGRLPQSMIELYLEAQGDWEAMDHGWDIMIERDVPPERIEAVVRASDPAVQP